MDLGILLASAQSPGIYSSLIDKLNIIVPITKLIIPTKKDCINISIIIIRKKILLIKYLKYLINNNYEQLGMEQYSC